MSTEVQKKPPMTAAEARICANRIRAHLNDARELILSLHEREGWKALGYKSWRECVVAEFDQSKSHLYRQLEAARIEREISPMGEKLGQVPERQIRPLAKLPDSTQRKEAWEEAKTETGGKPTAKAVEIAVNRRLPPQPKGDDGASAETDRRPPEPDDEPFIPPIDPPPHANGKSIVNGVESHDPPDIAKARQQGKIAPDVIVEVIDPEPADDAEPTEPEPADEESLSESEWLATLPVRELLSATRIPEFDADALEYRKLAAARKTFRHHASRALAKHSRGLYAFLTRRFLKIDHPRHWLVCPRPEDGGCAGSGEVTMVGRCPRCKGRGYTIR